MARSTPITAHVRPEIRQAVERLARQDGRTISQYVERLLIAHLTASDGTFALEGDSVARTRGASTSRHSTRKRPR